MPWNPSLPPEAKVKALFFKTGSFSLINEALWRELPAAMPEFDWQLVDVEHDVVRAQPALFLRATMEAVIRYGRTIIGNRQPPRDFFPRLPCVLKAVEKWAITQAKTNPLGFTFQTQSLFDARTGTHPHFLYTDHTYLANRRYSGNRSSLPVPAAWLQMERALYKDATATFVSSEFARESVIQDYDVNPERVHCVHSGCNVLLPEQMDDSERNGNVILFIGVDWERKGGPELLTAYDQVRKIVPNAELWIVGCDPGIRRDGVRIFGRLSGADTADCLRKADIFCLPSKMDPSASVLAEAAGYALPVVATPVGGNLERVMDGQTGFLCSPLELSERLLLLLHDKSLRQKMGRAGRELVFEQFTWPKVAAKIADRIRMNIA